MMLIRYPDMDLTQTATAFTEVKRFFGLTDRQVALLDDCEDLPYVLAHWRAREYGACKALLRFWLIIRY